MGFAPYGAPVYVDALWLLIHLKPGGVFAIDLSYFRLPFAALGLLASASLWPFVTLAIKLTGLLVRLEVACALIPNHVLAAIEVSGAHVLV